MERTHEFYVRYGPMVLRRASAILCDGEAAKDVLHEVFLKLIREPMTFREVASPVSYLYQATTHLCLNRLRDAKRHDALLTQHDLKPDRDPGGPSPDVRLTLMQMLTHVPEELQAIAIYAHVDRMSHSEIAQLVGVSRRTVGNRLEEFRRLALGAAQNTEVPS